MNKSRSVCIGLTLGLLFAFRIVNAQDAEKTKATIIFKVMDLDSRFAMIPANRDTECKKFFANQSKTEFEELKQLLEVNIKLFKPRQQEKLTTLKIAYEEILLSAPVLSKSIEDDEAAKQMSDRLHNMTKNILLSNLGSSYNLEFAMSVSSMAVSADVSKQNGLTPACQENANIALEKGISFLPRHYQAGQRYNSTELNDLMKNLITAFRDKSPGILQQTAALYANGLLSLTSDGKVAVNEADKAAKEEFLKKEITLRTIYPATKVYLKGKVKQLKEGEKYAIQYPAIADNDIYKSKVYFTTDAKSAKKDDVADYTFTIIAPGVTSFAMSGPKLMDGKVIANVEQHPEIIVYGYVRTMLYIFPVKIEVRNKAGELEKTIVVIDGHEELRDVFHGDFIRPKRFEEYNSVATIRPFATADSAALAVKEFKKEVIMHRLAVNTWGMAAKLISKALTTAYGSEKIGNRMYPIYGIKDPQPEYADLVILIDKTKDAISNIGNKEKTDGSIADLKVCIADYEQRLKVADITPNMRALCLINAAQAALMIDDIHKSVSFYKLYREIKNDDKVVKESYEIMLNSFSDRSIMTDVNTDPIIIHATPESL